MRLILLFVLTFVFAQTAFSQTSQIQDHSQIPNKSTSANKDETEKPSAVVKTKPAPETKTEANREREEAQQKSRLDAKLVDLTAELAQYTKWLAYATIALVVFTAISAAFVFRQARESRELFLIDQRPWLHVRIEPGGQITIGAHFVKLPIRVAIHNTGKSPAIETADGSERPHIGYAGFEEAFERVRRFSAAQSAAVGKTFFPADSTEYASWLDIPNIDLVHFQMQGHGVPEIYFTISYVYKSSLSKRVFETTKMYVIDAPIFLKVACEHNGSVSVDDLTMTMRVFKEVVT